MKQARFTDVTEMTGDEISHEQLQRMCNRYYWAGEYTEGRNVIEAACGAGAGLGYLASRAFSVRACDISDDVLASPRAYYGDRVPIDTADAAKLPYADASADVILLFEAIYYLPDPSAFVTEAKRVLRPGGNLLIVTANKDLYDFNPSPFSHVYYGVADLAALVRRHSLEIVEMAGGTPICGASLRQRMLRPVKKCVVLLGLMPRTMAGKKLLKRLVFGDMVPAPAEITTKTCAYEKPQPIPADRASVDHKVIFLAVQKGTA
jgi:SAM-dependent methyltransferase